MNNELINDNEYYIFYRKRIIFICFRLEPDPLFPEVDSGPDQNEVDPTNTCHSKYERKFKNIYFFSRT